MSELSRETTALLDRGRGGESFTANDKERLKRRVLAQIAGVSVAATTSTAAAWTTLAAKVIGVVVISGSVAGGVALLAPPRAWQSARAPTHDSTPETKHAQPAAMTKVMATEGSAPAAVAPAAPVASAVRAAPAERSSASVAPHLSVPVAPTSGVPVAALSLEEEARLLREADDALKANDPDRALRLLADLAARFPGSALSRERAAERVFALCMADRREEARQAAGEFLVAEAIGPLAARVRASCGGTGQ